MSKPENTAKTTGECGMLKLVSDLTGAYVSKNPVPVSDLPALIRSIHATLGSLGDQQTATTPTTQKPAVPIKKSVTDEHIICLEDGKKLKMLKRYLRSNYQLTPQEYRAKWGLPADYPMVAPNYAAQRSEFAKKNGLGRNNPAPRRRRANNRGTGAKHADQHSAPRSRKAAND